MKQLQTLSVVSPGFYGLNTQESGLTLSPNFSLEADNSIIDKFGRFGSRKGWVMQTTNGVTPLAGNSVTFLLEHINADNTSVVLSGGNNKLFKNGTSGSALVDITPASYTITGNNWKGASIYDHAIMVQEGHEPVIYTEAATPAAQTITDLTTVTQNYGTSFPHDVIAAYGRFWAHDGDSIYWSTDIADPAFPAFNGGTSGTLNISAVVPNNVDKITALAAHNGFLIIFCERSIVIYKGAENPLGDFSLSDVIAGTGCIARDSIQNTGNDLLFLSDLGVRSLGRVIQEKSLPMRELTKNVRDDLLTTVALEDLKLVRSVYSEVNAFYLLSFPSRKVVYCLDVRQALEDGSSRVSKWIEYKATSFLRLLNRDLLIGKENGIGKYSGYTDNGKKYQLTYRSHFLDMGEATTLKILKQLTATVFGGSGQNFQIEVNFDYNNNPSYFQYVIPTSSNYYYGEAASQFGVAEFSAGISLETVKASLGGSGNTIQIGFVADINGAALSVQKIDMFVKTGRMS